jgi:AcrR family transcriptional regulator
VSPIRVDKAEKKREILKAALAVFSQKGFHKTSMNDVAQKAEIAKGTLYDYFESKDELFLSLLDFIFAEFFEEFVAPDKTGDPAKLLQEVFLEGLKVYQKWDHVLRFLIFYWGESIGSEKDHVIQKKMRESFQRNRQWIEKIYLRGVKEGKFKKLNPTHVSASLMALAEFIPMQWLLDKKAFSLEEAGKTAFNLFLQGILK